jgi:hypothetical protein
VRGDDVIEVTHKIENTSLELNKNPNHIPLKRTPKNLTIFKTYTTYTHTTNLNNKKTTLITNNSNTSSTTSTNIPSIDNLKPHNTNFHTKDKRVEITNLEPKMIALTNYLTSSTR